MKKFASLSEAKPIERWNEHNGAGAISFRRMFEDSDFKSPIDFIDYTQVLSGSIIGRHHHHGNEEIYFVAAGNPLMRVDGEERRLGRGSFAIVRNGEWHELVNDTEQDVEILVMQVGLGNSSELTQS